ncbi:ATP-binding protein [Azospirillum doebereinerae]|uniref:ATP-binding protein n=1 Tax=Azospirillum doebereinerae TaxID=92933 RepID=A0A433JFF1_9PROT|nr:ATP-binding protein [Azospirillum doebereinerae]RUQ75881.1 ATP-binding protein [Azospirillum doebereinerae]
MGEGNENRVELVLVNDLAELERLAAEVEAFIERNDLPPGLAFTFNLCFDELITNTVSYGYKDGGPHDIHVRLSTDGTEMRAEVEDDGEAFNPFEEAPPPDLSADIDERRVGGLGVFLVRKTMDHAAYRRNGNRNLVVLAKTLAPMAELP